MAVYSPGTSNISLNQFGSNSAYTQATQYRYPRVSTGISVGSHYYGRSFNALTNAYISNSIRTGTTSIIVDWGASVTWSFTATFTGSDQIKGGTPVASDGYRVYMDSSTSSSCIIKIGSVLYGAHFDGWYSAPPFVGGYITSANSYAWSGSAYQQIYASWD